MKKQPVQQRSKWAVETILASASHYLETNDIDGFTTNKVAEVSGYSIGSIYQYFPNKLSIIRELFVTEMGGLNRELIHEIQHSVDATLEDIIAMIVERFSSRILAHKSKYREIVLTLMKNDDWTSVTIRTRQLTELLIDELVKKFPSQIRTLKSEARFIVISCLSTLLHGGMLAEDANIHQLEFQDELKVLIYQFISSGVESTSDIKLS